MAEEGDEKEQYDDWATPAGAESNDGSPPPSPSFAPVGRPMVKKRFRNNIPNPLRLDTPGSGRVSSLQGKYSVSSPWDLSSGGRTCPNVSLE